MKIPKSVIIAGRPYRLIYDQKVDGAEFTNRPGEIRYGKYPDENERMIWILHEIIEAILAMGNHRYESYPDKNDLFVFDHREYIKIVREIYLAIEPFLAKEKR